MANNWIEPCTSISSSKYKMTLTASLLKEKVYFLVYGRPKLIMRLHANIITEIIDGILVKELEAGSQRCNLYELLYWKNARSFEELLKKCQKPELLANNDFKNLLAKHRNRSLARNTLFLSYNYMDRDYLH